MVNDEKKERHRRIYIRNMIAQKNITDETLHDIICECAKEGWVEELRLAVDLPRSSVEFV